MPKSPHFNYYYSKLLDLDYCIHKKKEHQDKVYFSDNVVYTWDEIKEIKDMDKTKIKQIHDLKKQHPDYKISELISLLDSNEIEQEGLKILREMFDGEIIKGD